MCRIWAYRKLESTQTMPFVRVSSEKSDNRPRARQPVEAMATSQGSQPSGLSFCASSALPNWWSGDATTQREGSAASSYLPEAFTADPDRLARFQREAQVLASLNHPNIAQIHGLEESDGTRALVLELVEGPTLADMLRARDRKVQRMTKNVRQYCAWIAPSDVPTLRSWCEMELL